MAGSGIEKLATIESNSRAIIPLADIRDRIVTIDQLQEGGRATHGIVEHSHDSIQLTLTLQSERIRMQSEQIERIEKRLEGLQPPDVLSKRSVKALAHRTAGKPAALRELCDTIYDVPEQQPYQRAPPGLSPYQPPDSVPFPVQGRRMTSGTQAICICPLSPRSHRSKIHRTVRLGKFHLSEEQETRGHWPSCPLSRIQPTRKNHRTVGFKYTGLARILSSIVGASFTLTSGAGGFSIGANLTYYPTVDVKSDPSFCIMRLIDYFSHFPKENKTGAFFMNACIKRLERLFNEKKAYPTAVNDKDESLMHLATKAVWWLENDSNSPFGRRFLNLSKPSCGMVYQLSLITSKPTPLAAAKPAILSLLAQVADIDTLKKVNITGTSALEVAMIRSGDRCIHGTGSKRCRRCGCIECVEILLKAGCCVRMHALGEYDAGSNLQEVMEPASEFARRLYVYEMQEVRRYLLHTDYSDSDSENSTVDGSSCSSDHDSIHGNNNEAEEQFNEFEYGGDVSATYICWLVKHGADLFSKPSTGPLPCDNDAGSGLFGAHYAFFLAGERIWNLTYTPDHTELDALLAFNKLSTTVVCCNLTDGCICHCSTGGCSPFLWMMKAFIRQSQEQYFKTNRPLGYIKTQMEFYYSTCGTELTVRTYEAAIRYATFQALELIHICCDVWNIIADHDIPNRREAADDVIVNEEQAPLIELHETLVTELTEMALTYLESESFPEFWGEIWLGRVEKALDKLNGCNLSDAERRGAENIGVRWCEPPTTKETKTRNPYKWNTPEWYFFELDLICPD
ncbi:uncharacterized protein PG986_015078 [Apiospora aurea]|uniref:Uncharacterized protein n=1 Tax=Apiospora aurea TaxID=335848 RepID=A0ABR1PRJ3_9PEZI